MRVTLSGAALNPWWSLHSRLFGKGGEKGVDPATYSRRTLPALSASTPMVVPLPLQKWQRNYVLRCQLNDTHKTNPIAKYHFICRFCRFHNALLKDLFASKTIENKKHVFRSWLNKIKWQRTYFKKCLCFAEWVLCMKSSLAVATGRPYLLKKRFQKSFKDHWPCVGTVG